MARNLLNNRLSSLDAAFLYVEKETAPMHIGGVDIIEGEVPFKQFVQNIDSKLHLIPRYLQKAVPAPYNIGHPTWEFDPNFKIENHIFRVQLDPPGSEEQLRELSGRLFEGMLDRNKPLWELYLIEGMEGGRTALFSRVHHCLADGASGVELLKIIMDISPEQPAPAEKPPREFPPAPDPVARFYEALWANAAEGLGSWIEFQTRLMNLGLVGGPQQMMEGVQAMNKLLAEVATPADRLPFNKPFSGKRRLAWSEYSFAEARGIRAACGGTVNDVVLAMLGGAVGRYVESHGQSPAGRSLKIMVPVNVRSEDERAALGNRVSVMPTVIPLDMPDPIARLKVVRERTEAMKQARMADRLAMVSSLLGTVPPALQSFFGMMTTSPPVLTVNMVCTNVPGPQIPLYVMGRKVLAHYPLAPVGYEVGVSCAVMSYNQRLFITFIADGQAAPDVDRLKEYLDQAYVELREAAGVKPIEAVEPGRAKKGRSARRLASVVT